MHGFSINANLLLELTREKIGIDDLVDRLDDRHAFEGLDEDEIVRAWKKTVVRRAAKTLKDKDGYPLIFSIVFVAKDGKPIRKYKQIDLFNLEEFRQVIEEYRQIKDRFGKIEKWLRKKAKEKFGAQALLFPDVDSIDEVVHS